MPTRDLVRDLAIESRVRYLGWCGGARLAAFYDAIDVLVQPSTYEPFGLAALEGAARGIPVVCTAVDGLVEVLASTPSTATTPAMPLSVAPWNAGATWTPTHLQAMGSAARARVLQQFTDVAMARRYLERFRALCGPGVDTEENPA